MKRLSLIAALLVTLFAGSCTMMDSYRLCNDPDQKAIVQAFAEAKHYEFGKDNAPLILIGTAARQSQMDPTKRLWFEQQFMDMLQDQDATDDAKDFACRHLYYVGTDNCVYVLEDYLLNEKFSNIARYALERNPHPSVDKLLQKALPKSEGAIKVGILNTMAARGNEESLVCVIGALDDSDPAVVGAAMHALGEIGTPVAGATLGYMKERRVAPELESSLYDAYLRCAEKLHQRDMDDYARQMFLELYSHEMPTRFRIAALRGLAMTSERMALEHLPMVLNSNNPEMSAAAAQLIRDMPDTPPTEMIAATLPEAATETQILLLEALIDRGDKAALPRALELTKSEDETVRTVALRSLATFGNADTVQPLLTAATNATGGEKQAAQYGLNRITGEGVNEKMIGLLDTALAAEKVELVKSLAARRAFESVPALLKTAADGDKSVQMESYRSLAILAGADDVNSMLTLLMKVEDSGVRKEAEKTAITVCQKASDPAQNVVGAYDKTTDTTNRCSLLRIAGKFGGEKAFERTKAALSSEEKELSDTAVRVLADWPDSLAISDLKDIAQNSDQEIHRVLAFRGFVRLVGADGGMTADQKFTELKDAFEMAKRPEEKKLALSGLGVATTPEALKMAQKYLDDAELKSEASMTVLKIAKALPSDQLASAQAAVEQILAGEPEESVAKEAQAALDAIEKEMDHIVRWEVSGPFMKEGIDGKTMLTKVEFPPEDPGAKGVEWKEAETNPDRTWYLDLSKLLGAGENRVGYMRAKVWSPEKMDARLEVGSDDGIRVWLNQEQVMTADAARGCAPSQDKVNVVLKKGWNDVLVKVNNIASDWGACARFRTTEGRHIEGLKYGLKEE